MTVQADRRSPAAALRRQLHHAGVATRDLTAAGMTTAVLECGMGDPVVMLHGPGEFAETWLEVVPPLAATHRVVIPDLPGHGMSGGGGLDVARVVEWLGELIEQTVSAPPAIVGHVAGGAIAARFAIEHPDRVRALVLVDTMGLAPFEPAPPFGEALERFFGAPSEATYEHLMQYCSNDVEVLRRRLGDRWATLAAYAVDRARTPSVAAAAHALVALFGVEIPERELRRIAVPTTLIWGRNDLATSVRVAEDASRSLGWPLRVIENAADDPALDQPVAFAAALAAALAGEVAR